MNNKIFRDAFHVYQGGMMEVTGITDRTVTFKIKDVDVRVENRLPGLKLHCGCEAHMKRMAQDKLCKRTIAALVYLARQKKIVQSAFMQIASKMSAPYRVWLEEETQNKAFFDVEGKKVWLERIPTGTRVRTIKDDKVIQDVLSLEMIAVLLYTYDHRGKLKR